MALVEWDGSLETGDAHVDEQHRALFDMFNDLYDIGMSGSNDGVEDVLGRLMQYVAVHFTDEQDLMVRAGYPPEDVMEHVEAHQALTNRTREMVGSFLGGEMTTVLPLSSFLHEWLGTHIRKMDRRLVDYVRAKGSAA